MKNLIIVFFFNGLIISGFYSLEKSRKINRLNKQIDSIKVEMILCKNRYELCIESIKEN